jgi:hypothetical protein
MLTSQPAGSPVGLLGIGALLAMKTTIFLLLGLACVAVVFAVGVRGEAGRRFGGCGVDGLEGGDDCGGI